jgi:hypothetical protein
MKVLKHSMLSALLGFGVLLAGTPASASLVFNFAGKLDDGDRFYATLTTEETLTTVSAPAHTNSVAGLTSPAYTFTGYRITGISGSWFEAGDPTAYAIVGLLPIGSIIENSPRNNPAGPDTIAHSPTDNLFDPKTVGELALGKVSFGGFAFDVNVQGTIEDYQLYTDPVTGKYAGCPGSCVVVTEIDAPGTLPLMGLGLAVFAWSQGFRRRKAHRS